MTHIPVGEVIGTWLAALLTFAIFSFLYKDNPLFKVAEAIFLGTALGYSICLTYYSSVWPKGIQPWWPVELLFHHVGAKPPEAPPPISHFDLWIGVIIPLVLALFVLLRMIPALAWLSRYSFAIYIAGAAGLAIPAQISAQFLPQITKLMDPINGSGFSHGLTQVIMLVGLAATVTFFFFSLEHKGAVGRFSRLGVLFVMISFGASFGNTVMARVSLLIGRFQFLVYEWWQHVVMHRV